jgi:branched-chain amino acid transport system substrate-binding protein
MEIGKENVEKWHVVGAMDPESKDPMTVSFLKDFGKRFGRAPNTFATQAYDAMMVILGGLAKNGPDREKLQSFVPTVKDYNLPCRFRHPPNHKNPPFPLLAKDGGMRRSFSS